MKELYDLEKKPGETSYPGVLKMVRVKKGKKGQKKSRSLVFRISRIPNAELDDSGISCITPENKIEDNALSDDQIENVLNPSSSENETALDTQKEKPADLKLNVPKSVLLDETIKEEPVTRDDESRTAENLAQDLALDEMHQYLESSNVIANIHDLQVNASDARDTPIIPEARGYKSCEKRRSSRRILLKLQKEECHQMTTDEKTPEISKSQDAQYPAVDLKKTKRKREQKPILPGEECKKRRGRPPKSLMEKTLSIVPIGGNSEVTGNEKLFYPPKNSVWTLVPKELFESEFFKSQVLKFRLSSPAEKKSETNFLSQRNIPFPRKMTPTSPVSTPKIQLKYPNVYGNTTPATEPSGSDTFKVRKRPTVIYFKPAKKSPDFSTCEYTDDRSPQQPQFSNKECSRTENDMLYSLSKYKILEDTILKQCYEQVNGDINETENMLSDLLLKNPALSPDQHSSFLVPKNDSVCATISSPVSDYIPCTFETQVFSDSFAPVNDIDTLSRCIIAESLRILYSEEAVLS